jgi:hypothetical protein
MDDIQRGAFLAVAWRGRGEEMKVGGDSGLGESEQRLQQARRGVVGGLGLQVRWERSQARLGRPAGGRRRAIE